jgi:membrane dipeptidase
MKRMRVLVPLAVVVALVVVISPALSGRQDQYTKRALQIQGESPLIDGHNDLPWEIRAQAGSDFAKLDIGKPQPSLMTDIARLRAGRVGGQFWSVYVPVTLQGQAAVTAALEQIDIVHRMVGRYPETFELALTADDVERIFKKGKVASIIGMEGGHSIDSSLGALRMFYRLGARYLTLTHSGNIPWADSATDTPAHNGLTAFGKAVVREMNWLGMLVDLSHVSPAVMAAALDVSEAPVIFSHSSARALCDVPRNVPDDILRRLPTNGGVVMVSFVPGFTSPDVAAYERLMDAETERQKAQHPNDTATAEASLARWHETHPSPKATIAQIADHIDYVRKMAGIDHVGIGSDFDGITSTPEGLADVSTFPALTAELLRRGYSDQDVKKVLGLNVLAALRRAEQVADRLQAARPASTATIEQLDGKGGSNR